MRVGTRANGLLALVAVCLAMACPAAAQQENLISWLRDTYDCSYALPMRTQSPDSANQVGAIHIGLPQTPGQGARWMRSKASCVPLEDPGFTFTDSVSTKDFRYKLDAGAQVKIAVKDLFELLDIDLAYINEVKFNLTDFKIAAPAGNRIAPVIEKYWDDKVYCRPRVLCAPGRTVAVSSACQAKVAIEMYFKAGATINLVNAVMQQLQMTIGATLKYTVEQGAEGNFIKITSDDKPVIVGLNTTRVWDFTSSQCR